jgi:hypothetical protein
LLSRQIQLSPNNPEAVKLGTQIAAIANSALTKSEIAEVLKTEEVPIEEKINAAMGRDYQPDKKKPPRFLKRMMELIL